MRKATGTIEEARSSVLALMGKSVIVRHNKGRNKIVVYDGIVTEAYGGVFFFFSEKLSPGRISFSYKDVLCGDIRLKETVKPRC